MKLQVLNFGKLREKVPLGEKIVYYRKGLEELSLNINNACPNACTFCIRDRDKGWGVSNLYLEKDPSVQEILYAFEEESKKIQRSGTYLKKVKICGYGEPILRFNDLFPIIEYIKNRNPETNIQVTTTGWPYFRFVSKDLSRLDDLRSIGLDSIYLSLSTLNPETYRKLVRPGINKYDSQAFEDSIKFGIGARDLGLEVILGFMNLAGINEKEVRTFVKKLGINYKIREFES